MYQGTMYQTTYDNALITGNLTVGKNYAWWRYPQFSNQSIVVFFWLCIFALKISPWLRAIELSGTEAAD